MFVVLHTHSSVDEAILGQTKLQHQTVAMNLRKKHKLQMVSYSHGKSDAGTRFKPGEFWLWCLGHNLFNTNTCSNNYLYENITASAYMHFIACIHIVHTQIKTYLPTKYIPVGYTMMTLHCKTLSWSTYLTWSPYSDNVIYWGSPAVCCQNLIQIWSRIRCLMAVIYCILPYLYGGYNLWAYEVCCKMVLVYYVQGIT